MKRIAVACLLPVLLCCSGAAAMTRYNFVLEGSQVVPPSGSTSWARGVATLNVNETELDFVIDHDVASPISAAVHRGDFGTNGPVVYSFTSTTSIIIETWMLSPADVADLQAGLLYVEITSAAFPGGDIRGQIAPNPNPQPGEVIITEIMYNPASTVQGPAVAEWIELFNPTYTDIEIGGWFFQDEDTQTGDPCTLASSGTIPAFLLPAGGLVVIIPDGGAPAPTVGDFRTAWNLDQYTPVVQLNGDGTAGGAVVGDDLADGPFNDGNDANDLPLLIEPCDPGNPTPHTDNEVLTLNDGSQVMDLVNFDYASPWPEYEWWWPECNYAASITLVPADYPASQDLSTYTGTGNDNGANWILHTHSDDAGGREQVTASGIYDGQDIGSPGYLWGASSGNHPPTANSQTVRMEPGTTVNITLTGHDNTLPFFGMFLILIRTIPENGQLIHTQSGHVITAEDVAGGAYLVPTVPFNKFQYVNDGTCGKTGFLFQAYDALLTSPDTKVEIIVQCGDVAITEIMYNPDSAEGSPSVAEWVELYNTTGSPIDLAGWYLQDNEGRCGDLPSYILGPAETVAVIPSGGDTSEFLQAWSAAALQPTQVLETTGGALTGFSLANCGDELQLVMPGGTLPLVSDAVYYDNGGSWPSTASEGPSIYVVPPAGQYTAYANDDPSVWARSVAGTHGARQNTATGIYDGIDTGSPGYVAGICGNAACEVDEDACGCPADCGAPPGTETPNLDCNDGADNDCDGNVDCFDPDCYPDPACVQACCFFPEGTCSDLDRNECVAQGGLPRGAGIFCAGDGNGNNIDDICEGIPTLSQWGLLVMVLLLLAAGSLVIARRRSFSPGH